MSKTKINVAATAKALTSVINDHGFSEHRGGVFGVSQFGVEVEFKVGIIVHLLVSQPDDLPALCSFHILFQDIVDDRVNVLIHILEKKWEAVLDGHLQLLQKIGIVER